MSKLAKRFAEVEEFEEEEFERSQRPTKARTKGRPIDQPAGPKRREAMARVQDELEEDIAAMPEGATAVKLKDIKIDGEIISNFNSGHVSNADPAFVYAWKRYVAPFGGTAPVDYDLALTIRTSSHGVLKCWEKVNGLMTEAIEHRAVDGTRKIGDVMLLRCRKDVYAAIQQWEADKREHRLKGPASTLQSLGDRTGIHVRVDDVVMAQRGVDDPVMKHALKHAAANEIANRQLDTQIREGRVRGMEVGG